MILSIKFRWHLDLALSHVCLSLSTIHSIAAHTGAAGNGRRDHLSSSTLNGLSIARHEALWLIVLSSTRLTETRGESRDEQEGVESQHPTQDGCGHDLGPRPRSSPPTLHHVETFLVEICPSLISTSSEIEAVNTWWNGQLWTLWTCYVRYKFFVTSHHVLCLCPSLIYHVKNRGREHLLLPLSPRLLVVVRTGLPKFFHSLIIHFKNRGCEHLLLLLYGPCCSPLSLHP